MYAATPNSSPPLPGSAAPGHLYSDLATQSLWLGVDPSVDLDQAVLIADLIGTLELIETRHVEAKAYTDEKVALRAPLSHTHTTAQIVGFNDAVEAIVVDMPSVNWIRGMIVIWSGAADFIGEGDLAGWQLCDGTNGTPDLREKFIMGAGERDPGANTPVPLKTDVKGGHTHDINPTAITINQMPAHAHGVGTFRTKGNTDEEPAHVHTYATASNKAGWGAAAFAAEAWMGGVLTVNTSSAGKHLHGIDLAVTGTSQSIGGSAAHDHTMKTDGSHDHSISVVNIRDSIPWYALCYIMKL